jgi:cadmium resistance protein CadD (predicted permease)
MSSHQTLIVLARGGYAARGVLYLIIGIFALLAARDSTRPKDSHKSLEALLGQPFGYFLVGLVVAGLLAFAAWRVLQATRDVDHHGKNLKGLIIRAGLFTGGLANGALAFFALGLLVSGMGRSGKTGGQTKDWLAHLLSWEYSNAVVYLIALIPLGVGIAHLIKGWKASFEKYFEADEDVMRYVRPVSRFGLIARGVVFIEIALLLAVSGSAYQAVDPPGMKEALDALQNLPAGWLVLMVMALGLIAFSVYSFAEAFWRKINMELPAWPHV